MSDNEIEKRLQAAGANAPRLSPADVEAVILSEFYFTAEHGIDGAMARGELHARHKDVDTLTEVVSYSTPAHVTFCLLMLKNGTKVVGVNHGALVADNFRAEIARDLARQDAIDQIWPMLGYEMRSRLTSSVQQAGLNDARITPATGAPPTPSPVEPAPESPTADADADAADRWKPTIGRVVTVKGYIANGTDEHPGMITRVFGAGEGALVNVTAFPDLQSPKILSSIPAYTSRTAARDAVVGPSRANGYAFFPDRG